MDKDNDIPFIRKPMDLTSDELIEIQAIDLGWMGTKGWYEMLGYKFEKINTMENNINKDELLKNDELLVKIGEIIIEPLELNGDTMDLKLRYGQLFIKNDGSTILSVKQLRLMADFFNEIGYERVDKNGKNY